MPSTLDAHCLQDKTVTTPGHNQREYATVPKMRHKLTKNLSAISAMGVSAKASK